MQKHVGYKLSETERRKGSWIKRKVSEHIELEGEGICRLKAFTSVKLREFAGGGRAHP